MVFSPSVLCAHIILALLIFVYSKLAWMNMGYKNKYASPLADLLAFRKVVLLLKPCYFYWLQFFFFYIESFAHAIDTITSFHGLRNA